MIPPDINKHQISMSLILSKSDRYSKVKVQFNVLIPFEPLIRFIMESHTHLQFVTPEGYWSTEDPERNRSGPNRREDVRCVTLCNRKVWQS